MQLPAFSLRRMQTWWVNLNALERWSFFCLIVVMGLGSAFRLANLGPSLQFQADQGRDALVAYGILHGDVALVGPSTSVGSMFLGPLYYYFMAPFLFLAGWNPVGPAAAVALIGILTLPVLYFMAKRWFGTTVATFSILLYAAAPWVVEYTRFSWNPNPAPLVSLVLWWSAWQAFKGKTWYWALSGLAAAILIQLHYVALLAVAPVGIIWLWRVVQQVRLGAWKGLRQQVLWSVVALIIVMLSTVPLVIFDFRFNGIIRAGFADFFTASEAGASNGLVRLKEAFGEQEGRALYVFGEFWGGKDAFPHYRNIMRAGLLFLIVGWCLWGRRMYRQNKFDLWLYVSVMILSTVAGLAWYRGVVYAHYITYFYPVVVLVVAAVLTELTQYRWLGKLLALGILAACISGGMLRSSQRYIRSAGWQYTDMQRIANQVLSEVPEDQTYSLALLSEIRDYRGMNYRYFLVASGRPPVTIGLESQADILVIIAESPDDPESVLNSPVYEIATYPRGEYRVVTPAHGPKMYFVQRAVVGEQSGLE